MFARIVLTALAVASSSLSLAQATGSAALAVAPARAEDVVRIALDTSAGRIIIALDRGRAPITVANFLHYVESGKLNGESFYRAMPYGKGGLIQGGVTSDARKLATPIAHEAANTTGLKHVAGTISMANFGPGTARSDFFIITTDIPAFDDSFAAFGRVVEGMDVVQKILVSPVSPTKGEGVMKGQMLEPKVTIAKAVRLK